MAITHSFEPSPAQAFAELWIHVRGLEEANWWNDTRRILHDLSLSNIEPVGFPPEITIKLINNKVKTNKAWERKHLEFLRDEVEELYLLEERMIMFTSRDDLKMFMLKFA